MSEPAYGVPPAPAPRDREEAERIAHSALRWRMLYGRWDSDLALRIQQAVGSVKAQAWGLKDISSNIARGSCSAVATLYDRAPGVTGNDEVADLIATSGYWSLQQRNQRDTIGMRELFVRIVVRENGIVYLPVPPHRICATPDPEDPSRALVIKHQRWRPKLNAWLWDVWEPGCYRVEDDAGKDLSDDAIGGRQEGDRFVARDASGEPFLPWTVYHAARTGELFDPYEARELWEGSLNSAVGWTMWQHVVKDASWPQRWILGAVFKGLGIVGDGEAGKRAEVVTDPATVVQLEPAPDFTGQPGVGQWAAGMDPEVLANSLDRYDRRVAAYGGINPADVQRVSGDPRSGYAIAITREAQREAQRRYSPVFAPCDEELVAKTAMLLNRVRGKSYPESGYRVIYESLPPTPDELEAQRKQLEFEQAAGMLSPVDVYRRLHPGVDPDQARTAILAARLSQLALDRDIEAAANAAGLGESDDADLDKQMAQASKLIEDFGLITSDALAYVGLSDVPLPQAEEEAPVQQNVQDQGLNGAQISGLLEILAAVSRGELSTDAAVGLLMVAFPNIDAFEVHRIAAGALPIVAPTSAPTPTPPA